ncbi:ArsR/SmtB family transcription factor [Subtercola endophyticus]|uniref:ArsR/SmtB family transcription factor n=1 Tax=Subtercola endophyticus TaxID=2895559 RepID=UPI001E629A05|nr:metalloregulator ArsR/SmtB family transcription factor [Subtercola endophyticus]UFS57554.1 metalloregulator ArsR/SmtB family transcription factor [Subtercola endophyticus]
MVVEKVLTDEDVNRIFRALADATRRDIVRRTLVAEVSVSQLADSYDMSFAAVQKHVAVLEEARLVTKQPRGRERMVRGEPERIRQAQRLLDQFEQLWRSRIDRLDALLSEQTEHEQTEHEHPEHEQLEREHPENEKG